MIFISYRISDSIDMVRSLDADLTRAFGADQVFRDKTRLEGGQDWTEILEYNAKTRKVMLVVMGPTWQTTSFDDGDWKGVPRLWNPEDWVRKEITFALDADNIIIPISINPVHPNESRMPPEGWLRSCGLDRLYRKQGIKLRSTEYERDFEELVKLLIQKCPTLRPASTSTGSIRETPAESTKSDSDTRVLARRSYLRWLVQSHERLEYRGIRHARGGAVSVALSEVYLALQADSTNPLERAAARQAILSELAEAIDSGEINGEEAEFAGWYIVSGSPIMPSIESRDRMNQTDPTQKEILNLGEAYFRESQLVVLGDPGSGKTTLARWLTLVLASACLKDLPNLEVPLAQVNPTTEGDKTISLGKTRIPILVRVAEYAEERQRHKDEGKAPPTLLEFLGKQTWLGSRIVWDEDCPECGSTIESKLLNQFFRDILQAGEALIILDGLDEVPASALRDEIVEEVDVFASQWIRRRHAVSTLRGEKETKLFLSSVTADTPGNRLIITSRIAGYHLSPLQGDLAHVTVEPMSPQAVAKFIRNWMKAVHQETAAATTPIEDTVANAQQETEQFLAKLNDPRQRGGRELATNPLLCGILATIFRQRKGDLPQERVELYHQAVEILFDVWLRRSREDDSPTSKYELYDILEPIAEHVHRHEPTGLIPENQLKQLTLQYLAESRGENPLRPTPKLRQAVDEIVRIIREDVGLIAARGEGVYGFLHLTFQEYLAARSLVRDPDKACARISEHIGDSRWREAIRLALGHLNIHQPKIFLELVRQLLETETSLSDLLPQEALTIVGAFSDLRVTEGELIEAIADKLLLSYQNRELLSRLPRRRELLLSAFQQLASSDTGSALESFFTGKLKQKPVNPQRNAAIAHLLLAMDFLTPSLFQTLHQEIATDLAEWNYPIATLLRRGLTPRPKPERFEPIEPDYDSIALSPPFGCLPFRKVLQSDSTLTDTIRKDYDWLRVVLSLFGGAGDYSASQRIDEYVSIAGFLQQEDAYRERFRQAYIAKWGKSDGDYVYNMSMHLTDTGSKFELATKTIPYFHPLQVFRESAWSQEILSALRNAKEPRQLLSAIHQHIGKGDLKAEEAEIVSLLLNENSSATSPPPVTSKMIDRVRQDVSDAVARCSTGLPEAIGRLEKKLSSESLLSLYEASMTQVLECGGMPNFSAHQLLVEDHTILYPHWLAESLVLVGQLGTSSDFSIRDFGLNELGLLSCHTMLRLTCNRQWKYSLTAWPVAWLPPEFEGDLESLASHHLISTIEDIPDSFGGLRYWVIYDVLKTFIEKSPNLLPEILASALGDSGPKSCRDALFQSFAPELVSHSDAATEVYHRITALSDVFHRARALLRLASHWPERRTVLTEEAAKLAENLQNTNQRQHIYEWLCSFVDTDKFQFYFQESCKSAELISNPDSQARAWGRLACAASLEDAIQCLKNAYKVVPKIEDELERSNCIRLLRKISGVLPELDGICKESTDSISDPILKARTEENWGLVFRLLSGTIREIDQDKVVWAVLSVAAEVNSIEPTMDRDSHRWRKLIEDPCQQRVDDILQLANGALIECTPAVALSLERLQRQGHTNLVMQVYPRLRINSRELVPYLRRQLKSGPDRLAHLSGLFWAEVQGLSIENVSGVIESLIAKDDLTGNRAAELLYGGPQTTTFRASLIGRDTLDKLFEAGASNLPERRNRIGHTVTWFCERLLYDAPEHIHVWGDMLRADSMSKVAWRGLGSAHFATPDTWNAMLKEFAKGPVAVQEALLLSFAHLRKNERLSGEMWSEFVNIANAPENHDIQAKGGVITELELLRDVCLAHLSETATTDSAVSKKLRNRLAEEHGFTWGQIFGEAEGNYRMKAIGQMFYTSRSNEHDRWNSCAYIAKNGVEAPGFLELLTEWTIESLNESIRDEEKFNAERTYLIELLSGCAMNAPARWHGLPQRDRIQSQLLRATMEQNMFTGRCDAVRLLGYGRHLSSGLLPALQAAMRDVEYVRNAAIESMALFRRMDPEVFPEIERWLTDESGLIAYATARLLTAIGRHSQLAGKADRTATQLRRNVIQTFAERIREPQSQRPLDFGSYSAPTPEIPQLCDFLFDCMLKVAGFDEKFGAKN
jgi:hypothetical protein